MKNDFNKFINWQKNSPLDFYLTCKNNPEYLYEDDEDEDEWEFKNIHEKEEC